METEGDELPVTQVSLRHAAVNVLAKPWPFMYSVKAGIGIVRNEPVAVVRERAATVAPVVPVQPIPAPDSAPATPVAPARRIVRRRAVEAAPQRRGPSPFSQADTAHLAALGAMLVAPPNPRAAKKSTKKSRAPSNPDDGYD